MKRIYTSLTLIVGIMIMLAAGCINADARSNDKKQKDANTSGTVRELTSAEFNTKVYDLTKEGLDYLGTKPAIIDFTAKWCGPCQRISPILDELAKEYEGEIVIYKVDIDKNQQLAQAFGVSSIPAILYIPLEGKPSMTVGSRDKARFKSEIDTKLLGKDK